MARDPTQHRLLDTAIEEFGAKGLDGASTRGIAAAAGTVMSAITYHYGGKDGLYLAAADHVGERIAGDMATGADDVAAIHDPAAAREAIHRMLGRLFDRLREHDAECWSLFILREQMRPTEAFDRIYGGIGPMLEDLVRLVRVAAGGADEQEARLTVLTLFGQVMTVRASFAACTRLLRVDAIDRRLADDLRRRIGANTDAILDCLAAERQEQP